MKLVPFVGVVLLSAGISAQALADSACAPVALAKFNQWAQPRMMVTETVTFGDGSTKSREKIVTENAAYAKADSGVWTAVQVNMGGRNDPSPEMMERRMGLASCSAPEHVQQSGQSATAIKYTYIPDLDGSAAEGTIWISDTTGLPLRQELRETGTLTNRLVARAIEADYSYNFQIPAAAELAYTTRLWRSYQTVNEMQATGQGGGGVGGVAQNIHGSH